MKLVFSLSYLIVVFAALCGLLMFLPKDARLPIGVAVGLVGLWHVLGRSGIASSIFQKNSTKGRVTAAPWLALGSDGIAKMIAAGGGIMILGAIALVVHYFI